MRLYRYNGGQRLAYRLVGGSLPRLILPGERDGEEPDPDGGTPSAWPDATNTGCLAAGATPLTPWSGHTFLAAHQVIDSRILTGHIIGASHVKITRCQINGRIDC